MLHYTYISLKNVYNLLTFLLVSHNEPSERTVKPVKNANSDKKISLAWRLLRTNSTSANYITPLLEEFKESRPYILNPKYSAPTSLPLYFFFGYQLLQELSNLMEKCGPVSYTFASNLI